MAAAQIAAASTLYKRRCPAPLSRVQLVRKEGRDVSTLYGREGKGGGGGRCPAAADPKRAKPPCMAPPPGPRPVTPLPHHCAQVRGRPSGAGVRRHPAALPRCRQRQLRGRQWRGGQRAAGANGRHHAAPTGADALSPREARTESTGRLPAAEWGMGGASGAYSFLRAQKWFAKHGRAPQEAYITSRGSCSVCGGKLSALDIGKKVSRCPVPPPAPAAVTPVLASRGLVLRLL